MKAEELKGKSVDELSKMLVDLKKEQVNQRFQKAGGQLEKSHVIRQTRRDIARVATLLSLTKQGKAPAAKAKAASAPKKKSAPKAKASAA